MKIRAYHFYAEYIDYPNIHTFSGVIKSSMDVFSPDFNDRIIELVAKKMTPQRPVEKVLIKSLTLLGEMDVEHWYE